MDKAVWTLPVPSTRLFEEDLCYWMKARTWAIRFAYEGSENTLVVSNLIFEQVEALMHTSDTATDADRITRSYDRLIDVGESSWLTSIRGILSPQGGSDDSLRHLMIYFDGGGCYEFICRSFRVEEQITDVEVKHERFVLDQ
jgi:hypothetical protein